jgi:hypothetical protein
LTHIIFTKAEDWYEIRSSPDCHLDEPIPLFERQISRPGVRRQTLCSPAYDNGDGIPRTLREDIVTRGLGYRGDSVKHHQVSVEWDFEVGIWASAGNVETERAKRTEGQEMG